MKTQQPSLRVVLEQLSPSDRSGDAAAAAALKAAEENAAGHGTPWFVRAMVAASAWVASLLLLTFVFGSGLVKGSASSTFAGVLIIAGAVALGRLKSDSPFLAQLGLALSLAGQVLFIGGIGEEMHEEGASLAAIAVSVALIIFYPDRTHRFLSTLIAVAGAAVFVREVHLPYGSQSLALAVTAAAGHLWFNESSLISGTRDQVMRPVAYGLIAGAILLLMPSIVPDEFRHRLSVPSAWTITSVLLTVLLLLLEYRLLVFHGRLEHRKLAAIVFGGTIALAAVSFRAPGMIGALFVLATGFHRGNRIITGLAVVFLGVFLTAYYYNMQITLLTKSYALLASGGMLILLRLFIPRTERAGEQEAVHE